MMNEAQTNLDTPRAANPMQAVVMPDLEQGLELVRCAWVNLDNIERMMPAFRLHPLLPLFRHQLKAAIEALDPEGAADFFDMA